MGGRGGGTYAVFWVSSRKISRLDRLEGKATWEELTSNRRKKKQGKEAVAICRGGSGRAHHPDKKSRGEKKRDHVSHTVKGNEQDYIGDTTY